MTHTTYAVSSIYRSLPTSARSPSVPSTYGVTLQYMKLSSVTPLSIEQLPQLGNFVVKAELWRLPSFSRFKTWEHPGESGHMDVADHIARPD